MRTTFVVLGIIALVVGAAIPASAITYGEPDNGWHPNVGAMMWDWDPDHDGVEQWCSGSLIESKIFLTASHCTVDPEAEGASVFVSFDDELEEPVKLLKVRTIYTNPNFNQAQSDPGDVAVLELAKPVNLTPARLPTEGLLDEMRAAGTLQETSFTAVGYGVTEPAIGGGPPTFPDPFRRMMSVSSFNALNDAWLRLSQNNATDDGGTCFGDSGGPNFIGAGEDETDVIASITVTGDAMCLATNDTFRMDIPSVRAFLDDFVTLP